MNNIDIHAPSPNKPTASVIFCVNRTNPHLRAAVQSVLNQTHASFEFLIGANACTDELIEELHALVAGDLRVRIFRTTLPQLAFTLNFLIEQSSSDLMIRMDADDVCEAHRFERLIETASARPEADVIGSWATLIDEHDRAFGQFQPPTSSAAIRRRMMRSSPIAHPTVAFRKKFWVESRGYLGGFVSEDFDFWLRAVARGATLVNIAEPLLRYRVHSAQVSRSRLGYAETAAHWYRELLARPSAYAACGWLIASAKAIAMPMKHWFKRQMS